LAFDFTAAAGPPTPAFLKYSKDKKRAQAFSPEKNTRLTIIEAMAKNTR